MIHDFVIIGAGAAGCIVAAKLAEAGKSVLLLEAGSDKPVGDWRDGEWMLSEYDDMETETDYPYNTRLSRVKAFGGSTEAWEGYSYRLEKDEFSMHSLYGMGDDWPISLKDLLPYYVRAERIMGVAGDHAEFNRPAYDRAPLPAFHYEYFEKRIIKDAARLGMSFLHVPQARNSVGYDRRRACQGVGVCNACPIGARWSPRAALRRELVRNSQVDIIPDAHCVEVLVDTAGAAKAVRVWIRSTEEQCVIAVENLVLAGGSIENIRLVLHSESLLSVMPAAAAENVGRGFMDHPVLRVAVTTDWNVDSRKRQTNILASCHDFRKFHQPSHSPGFLVNLNSRIQAPKALLAAHLEMLPHPDNRIQLSNTYDPAGMPLPKLCMTVERGVARASIERANAVLSDLAGVVGNDPDWLPLQLWACHHMGGMRMGSDEAAVVDGNLILNGTSNVYMPSLAVMPTSSSVNPTLTLAALSLRLADSLVCGG